MIPYSKPYFTGDELAAIANGLESGKLSGNGSFTQKCHQWLREYLGAKKVLLTTSCTSALEMAGMLLDLKAGDEVIMPSYTFVSSANAFVLRGCTPVFVDVRATDMNIDVNEIKKAMTSKTKAIVPIHYAGSAYAIEELQDLAQQHNIPLIVDGAQVMGSTFKGKPLASYGDLVAISFHDTKNIVAGEGGALVINNERFAERAEILWEKGTNRSQFLRGEVDKYTWVDIGSSFLPSELNAALLWTQLQKIDFITQSRLKIWNEYHSALAELEARNILQRPQLIPGHNAHIYFVILDKKLNRQQIIEDMKKQNVMTTSHYVPLHDSPAGKKLSRSVGTLPLTTDLSARLLRLPVFPGLTSTTPVIEALKAAINRQL